MKDNTIEYHGVQVPLDAFLAFERGAKADHISAVRAAGYSASEVRAAGYSASEVRAAGYSVSEVLAAGYSASAVRAAGYSVSEVRAAGYSASEVRAAGYSASEVRAAGYSVSEVLAAGYSASAVRAAGYSVSEVRAAGYSASAVRAAGYSASEVRAAGYSASEVQQIEDILARIPPNPKFYSTLLDGLKNHGWKHDQSTFGSATCETNICGTAMCTAGHLVHAAGKAGDELRELLGGYAAPGRVIHEHWFPGIPCQDFGSIPQARAMAYIEWRASEEARQDQA